MLIIHKNSNFKKKKKIKKIRILILSVFHLKLYRGSSLESHCQCDSNDKHARHRMIKKTVILTETIVSWQGLWVLLGHMCLDLGTGNEHNEI